MARSVTQERPIGIKVAEILEAPLWVTVEELDGVLVEEVWDDPRPSVSDFGALWARFMLKERGLL